MKNLLRTALILTLALSAAFGMLNRVSVFAPPDTNVNVGGMGNMIAGVDVDGDGAKEIYLVNDNWNDSDAGELVPRIYKLERPVGETEYQVVWEANAQDFADGIQQNTWPTLSLTDLDDDGKMELTWGIVNFSTTPSPYRIWVYEHAGGDNFGVQNPTTQKWEPTSVWTITDTDGKDIRPISWDVVDIDSDGTDEIIFASRKPDMTFGVCSVDDIPDDGAGTETWTLEFSKDDVPGYSADNKWAVATIGNSAYIFDEVYISKVTWNGSAYEYAELTPLAGGISLDGAIACDVDNDSFEEILVGEYYYGGADRSIRLLQESGDTLIHHTLFDLSGAEYLNGGRLLGVDKGDIDSDGNVDFIFGSRYSGLPNAMMFRIEYNGSGAASDPANWTLTFADSAVSDIGGLMWNVIDVCNMDDDTDDEVVYTSSVSSGSFTHPIVVLDNGDYTTAVSPLFEPVDFELGKAYPNPFNPSTMIPFTLSETGNVTLDVFNVKGQHVATLVSNEIMEAGVHNVMFDAGSLASGVYLYQLRVDNTVRAAKMVLNK